MSTVAAPVSRLRRPRASASWIVSDALVMTRRNLLQYRRVPELLVFSTIQPVMFVLLFAYVFGGAIQVPNVNYIDYLMPGIFVQTVVFGAMGTGIGLARNNPVSVTVDAVRKLVLGGADLAALLPPLAWTAAILIVFVPLSVRVYRRST